MAGSDSYIPTREAILGPWAQNLHDVIAASPAVYACSAADLTAYLPYVTAYQAAFLAATDPDTRNAVTIAAKDTARDVLVFATRTIAAKVRSSRTVTASQLTAAGLPVRDTGRTPKPVPAEAPIVTVERITSLTFAIKLRPQDQTRRGKPVGVAGALVYTYVPQSATDVPPTDLEKWRCEGIATRTNVLVDFEAADAGKNAYVVAVWVNARGEAGPRSVPAIATVAA